jgi:type VI protein secretion system component VasK
LLFGLAALTTKAGNSEPFSSAEKLWLAIALILFVAAAIAALGTNWPLKYKNTDLAGLVEALEAGQSSAEDAHAEVAFTRIEVLERAREKNRLKGRLLYGAVSLEVAAVACVGVAIFEVINP